MRSKHASLTRGRHWLVAGSAALLIAGGGTITWAATQQVGPPPAPPASTTTKDVTSSPSWPTTSAGPPTKKTIRPSAPPASPDVPAAMSQSTPVALRLPSISVESPVNPIGLNAHGALDVPTGDQYDEAAWYKGSPTPGQNGPAVIEGHVTGSNHNPSVFFELGDVRAGDTIEVDRSDGSTATFKVTKIEEAPKDDFPRIDVYGATPGPELRVITCGGTYNEDARRHVDNVIVFAKLVED